VPSALRNSRTAFSVRGPCRENIKIIREWNFTSLEFRSSKGTAVWPEEELEDSVCDVICAVL
jgi:hypothetical protein